MIKLKVFLYDSANENNGYRGTEFTEYVLQGGNNTEDITQELDTTEITFLGIDKEEQFTPSTKFIIDVYENDALAYNLKGEPLTYHREVMQDVVSQPILEDNHYFKHEISLAEPSVSFQHRTVDNIAVTYKLKDVSLQTKTEYNLNLNAVFNNGNGKFTPADTFTDSIQQDFLMYFYRYGKYLKYSGSPYLLNITNGGKYYQNIDKFNNNTATVRLPKLNIYGGVVGTKNFELIGQASYNYAIEEYNLNGTYERTVAKGTIISNSSFNGKTGAGWQGYEVQAGSSPANIDGWLCEGNVNFNTSTSQGSKFAFTLRQYANPSAPTPNYDISFPVQANKKYIIKTSLYTFPVPDVFDIRILGNTRVLLPTTANPTGYNDDWVIIYPLFIKHDRIFSTLPQDSYNAGIEFVVYSDSDISMILQSGNPYSLTKFIQKAILNSGLYKKVNGIATGDINHINENGVYDYPCPIYIDENFIAELNQTTIIENFYNQKNLWEVFLEAGYYIHAIPEIKFGANDKYMLTFNRLGQTDETKGVSTPVAIYNFRGIDDYVAEVDSYIDNMIQLGGYIDEWVSPKSNSEDFLVCNDNAEIVTSSKIIELLKLEIRANTDYSNICTKGQVVDATDFIYEENVYKILDIRPSVVPNKGIALYYQLGTNSIKGCTYRLPQANTTAYSDYTLKKVICSAFIGYRIGLGVTDSPWAMLKVNDFSFRVVYRTKSNVRQTHARPDLRKYLLKSKFDNVPTHRQFNNQQDILVDSEKFGSNLYGTLIRTGNTNYKKQEWVNSPLELKTKGEICRINDEIYYVAKVSNIFYSDHIESVIDYSKDYNQLSKVVGIPSEPRFYEISERSIIDRYVDISDYLYIGTERLENKNGSFINDTTHLSNLIFGNENASFARYAILVYKGDFDIGLDASTFGVADFYKEIIVPLNAYSSGGTLTYEMNMVDNFSAGDKIIEPVSAQQITDVDKAYKSLQAVQYTDMYGKATLMDFYILETLPDFTPEEVQNFPESPIAVRYTIKDDTVRNGDPYSLTDSQLTNILLSLGKTIDNTTLNDALRLNFNTNYFVYNIQNIENGVISWKRPRKWIMSLRINGNKLPISMTNFKATYYLGNDNFFIDDYSRQGLALIKDCRENVLIDYNLKTITSSDTFIFTPYLYQPKEVSKERQLANKPALSIVLLNEEVNKLSNGCFDKSTVISINGVQEYDFVESYENEMGTYGGSQQTKFGIDLEIIFQNILTDNDFGENGRVKSIVLAYNFDYQGGANANKFVLARNIPKTFTKAQALEKWIFQPYSKDLFTNKQ